MDAASLAQISSVASDIFHGDNIQKRLHGKYFRERYELIYARAYTFFRYNQIENLYAAKDLVDLDGRRILVKDWMKVSVRRGSSTNNVRQRLFSQEMHYDAFVFISCNVAWPISMGWIPLDLVESHEPIWISQGGAAPQDYYYEIDARELAPLPQECRFVEPCEHFNRWGGLWQEEAGGFECFGCGRVVREDA